MEIIIESHLTLWQWQLYDEPTRNMCDSSYEIYIYRVAQKERNGILPVIIVNNNNNNN